MHYYLTQSQCYSHHRLQQSPAAEVYVGQRPLPLRRGTAVRRQQRVQCPAAELLITLHFSQYETLNTDKKRHLGTEAELNYLKYTLEYLN